jgi:hypothetical protein
MSARTQARPGKSAPAPRKRPTGSSSGGDGEVAIGPAVEESFEAILATSPSPFSDAVLPNAYRETPDVPQIHRAARERCLSLVHDARKTNRTALQVILGDAGEGKTHLIAWLRRQSEEGWRKETATGRFALTVIPPLRSLSRARHHVLQEVVRQLSIRLPGEVHVDAATDTPIEILIWRALLAVGRILVQQKSTPAEVRLRLEDATGENPDRRLAFCVEELKQAWKIVGSAFVDAALRLPELAAVDREVFRTVARFPEGDEAERTAIVDWLGGAGLSSDRLEALGTSLVLDDEAEAARGLKTLLSLAQLAGTPVALAFDQIEGVARLGADAISELLGTITELYNEAPGTVLLLFCQTQLWPGLRAEAPLHVRDRLDDAPALYLKALTPEEAFLLVEARMKHFWHGVANGPSDALYPFTHARIMTDIERVPLRTPRAVVKHFHALLREPPEQRGAFVAPAPLLPADVVARKLDRLIDEERGTTRPPDSRAALVQSVAQDILQHASTSKRAIGSVTVEEVSTHRARKTSAEGLRIVLRRNDERRRVYVESSNSQHGKSAASTVKRLADVVSAEQADVALLLREESFPLPPVAGKTLIEMTSRGALLRLTEGQIAPLAAIEALLNAAAAGDLPVDRKTALEIAIDHLGARLKLSEAIVTAAFPSEPRVAPTSDRSLPIGTTVKGPPIDRTTLETYVGSVLGYLRGERAFEPEAQLATRLGMSVEKIEAAVHELASRGLVDVVADRNRAPIVLLRPEGLVP